MKTEWLAQLFIEVNGANLATKYMDRLIEVEVDDSLYLPDMFTIHLEDPNLEALRADVFRTRRQRQDQRAQGDRGGERERAESGPDDR